MGIPHVITGLVPVIPIPLTALILRRIA